MANMLSPRGSDGQTRYVSQQALDDFVRKIGGNPEDGNLTVEQDEAVRAFIDRHVPHNEIEARASSVQ